MPADGQPTTLLVFLRTWREEVAEDLATLRKSVRNTKHVDRITGSLQDLAKMDTACTLLDQRLRQERLNPEPMCEDAQTLIQGIPDKQISDLNQSLLRFNVLLSQMAEQRSDSPRRIKTIGQMSDEAEVISKCALAIESQAADLFQSVDDLCATLGPGSEDVQKKNGTEGD